jgi:hypothetical protein
MVDAKERGHLADWHAETPPLRSFAAGTLTVDDPTSFAAMALGANIEMHGFGLNWELDSPMARAFVTSGGRAVKVLS